MSDECGAGIPACLFIFQRREAVTEETGWKPVLRFRSLAPVRIADAVFPEW